VSDFDRSSLIESLGLEHDLLKRVAHRTHQWAQAIANRLENDQEQEESGQLTPSQSEALRTEAASLFTIAGSYRMLLNPNLARQSLEPAALHLTASRTSFAYPVAICGGSSELALISLLDAVPAITPADQANALLAWGWMDVAEDQEQPQGRVSSEGLRDPFESRHRVFFAREMLRGHLDQARASAQAPVGRLQIPLGAIAHVVNAADRVAQEQEGPARLSTALHDALVRMHDVTAVAMADRYHWRRLMSSVLPVEPEAVVLAGVAVAAAQRVGAVDDLFKRMDLPPLAAVPLLIGRELAEERS
jgi:hypothetical protein